MRLATGAIDTILGLRTSYAADNPHSIRNANAHQKYDKLNQRLIPKMSGMITAGNNKGWMANILTIILGIYTLLIAIAPHLPAPINEITKPENQYWGILSGLIFVILLCRKHIPSIAELTSKNTPPNLEQYVKREFGEFKKEKYNRVAIVDDQPDHYFHIDHIKKSGYIVDNITEISLSDVDALSKYNVIIMDISNVVIEDPQNGGAELMKRTRSNHPNKAIIAASSKQYDPSKNEFFKAANKIIDTPIRAADLEKAISDTITECYSIPDIAKEVDEIINSTSKHNQILKLSIKYLENKMPLEDFNRKLVNLDQSIDNMAIKELLKRIKDLK